ncbi:hypothetical protein C0991_010060 [Blastosporella zonata]|nr:hypothetical protein C0991_010060 [Blastosporella zonata]
MEHNRGRQLSFTAISRIQPPSISSSPPSLTPDYYDSPPSPPRSLEDQVHVAYAQDNFHLAKILLLRLKGIDVTDNDDPRIAEVKDEDFDFCFVPFGRLMDDDEEKALEELQKKELERVEQLKRMQRLKACEKIWEQGLQRLRELKTLALRKKELEDKEAENYRRDDFVFRRMTRPAVPRSVVSYRLVSPSAPSDRDPFVYDIMPPSPIRPTFRPKPVSHSQSKSPFTRAPLFDDSRTVPFSDVLASMQGPLFPSEQRPTSPVSNKSKDVRKHRNAELLDSLLVLIQSDDEVRRKQKGKAPERPVPRRKDSGGSTTSSCAACSSSSSTSSRRSWLSFSSSSSLSTAATTPSSSPSPSSSTPKLTPTSSFRRFLPPPLRAPVPAPLSTPGPCHCCCNDLTPVPISPADAPLPVLPGGPTPRHHIQAPQLEHKAKQGRTTVLRRLVQLVDLAKGFQNAYISAAMFAVPPSAHTLRDRDRELLLQVQIQLRVAPSSGERFRTHNAAGARAHPTDVRRFLSTPPSRSTPSFTPPSIPLVQLDEAFLSTEFSPPPSTPLPYPLPYKTYFSPVACAPRSPFRAVHGPGNPSEGLLLRVRNVESGVWMRVRAVENRVREVGANDVLYVSGNGKGAFGFGKWLRKPILREGALGYGKEKMMQVAFEGIGGSALRYELGERFPVAYDAYPYTHESVQTRERGRGREKVGGWEIQQRRAIERERSAVLGLLGGGTRMGW